MGTKRLITHGMVWILPVILFWFSLGLSRDIGPRYLATSEDPDYTYLLASTTLASGHFSSFAGHPGTPLQVLAAIVLRVLHPAASGEELRLAILADPETPLRVISSTLLGLAALSLGLLGWVLRRAGHSLLAIILAQSGPVFCLTVLVSLPRVYPETLLFSITCLFGASLVVWTNDTHQSARRGLRMAMLCGILAGIGVATKITFAPAFAALLVCGDDWKQRRMAVLSGILAFMVCLLPVMPYLAESIAWFYSLATKSGLYGTGETGLVKAAAVTRFISHLWSWEPFYCLFLLVGLSGAITAGLGKRGTMSQQRLLLAHAVFHVGMLVVVFKHPRLYYLLPSFVLLPVTLSIIPWNDLFQALKWRKPLLMGASIILGLILSIQAWDASLLPQQFRARTELEFEAMNFADKLRNQQHILVETMHCSSQPYALYQALRYNSMEEWYAKELRETYPNAYTYDTKDETFTLFNQPVNLVSDPGSGRYLILHGSTPGMPVFIGHIQHHLREKLKLNPVLVKQIGDECFFVLEPVSLSDGSSARGISH